ncbi:CMD domain protein [Nakamurella deserti]|uniref:CMD domain protein n=1 Tax=Nakamurella deserti TaxID=2164074 RepID=UPI00197BA502|nr:CMD domain protein [Nakamurella deserti]
MTTSSDDVIDTLAGITAGSPLDGVRRARPDTRSHAQAGYDELFTAAPAGPSAAERQAVAAFVAVLHAVDPDSDPAAAHYRTLLAATDATLAHRIDRLARAARTTGPYGAYPASTVLAAENTDGLRFTVPGDDRPLLGERLAAALDQAHLLVFRPREAGADDLAALQRAGWAPTEIVTVTQLVGFLAFQLRLVTGLRTLKELV